MSRSFEVSLEQRQLAYDRAQADAESAAVAYVEARAAGFIPEDIKRRMDRAQEEFRRAKSRLEKTERRIRRNQR